MAYGLGLYIAYEEAAEAPKEALSKTPCKRSVPRKRIVASSLSPSSLPFQMSPGLKGLDLSLGGHIWLESRHVLLFPSRFTPASVS